MASDAPPPTQMGWLETQFLNLHIAIWILIACCCSPAGIILGAIGYFTSTNPKAKQNALITLIVGVVLFLLGGGIQCFGGGMNAFQKQ
jgi:hypothetical protein